MSRLGLLLLIATVALDAAGQIAFKAAAIAPGRAGAPRWATTIGDPRIWFGVALYVVEFVLWLAFLSIVPLSNSVLLASLNIVVVMIAGRFVFGERLCSLQLASIGLIVLGVGLVGMS